VTMRDAVISAADLKGRGHQYVVRETSVYGLPFVAFRTKEGPFRLGGGELSHRPCHFMSLVLRRLGHDLRAGECIWPQTSVSSRTQGSYSSGRKQALLLNIAVVALKASGTLDPSLSRLSP